MLNILACMENRFEEVHTAMFFWKLVPLLDVQTWPKTINNFEEEFIAELSATFMKLLEKSWLQT